MINGGISIKGSYHDVNQDYFICEPYKEGYIMVVSDGMGSKKMSQYGSKSICESIHDVISNFKMDINLLSFKDVLCFCHEEWKKRLAEYDITQCYATLLVVIVMNKKIKAARLGDGFLAIYTDNKISCLFDKKEGYFANQTDCLRETFDREKIDTVEVEYETFKGVVSCTDGIEIRTMQESDLIEFTKDFIEEYSGMEKEQVMNEIGVWLTDWPGYDDKTLAFLMEGAK